MGLDIYLFRTRIATDNDAKKIKEIIKDNSNETDIVEVKTDVAYWRKANAIHHFFMNINKNSFEKTGEIRVSLEDIQKLLDICKRIKKEAVLKNERIIGSYTIKDGKEVPNYIEGQIIENQEICEELLPTESGFFFGPTEYNSFYMNQIDSTIEQLEKIIESHQKYDVYTYIASW